MRVKNVVTFSCTCCVLLFLLSCQKEITTTTTATNGADMVDDGEIAAKKPPQVKGWIVIAKGLNNPRGLEFGPDRNLYVAEAGTGGPGSVTGGRISMINTNTGVRKTVTTDLPTSTDEFGDVNGPVDVSFVEKTLYALVDGGATYGVPSKPSGIYKVNTNGSTSLYANLSEWQKNHPVAHPPQDFDPDGSWYNLLAVDKDLYALDANHGELVKVNSHGSMSRVIDFSATQGHSVPTALDYKGNFYVGNLGTFPIQTGSSKILKVEPNGKLHTDATGLSAVVGLVIDKHDWIYVLELGDQPFDFQTPGKGLIYAVSPKGEKTLLVSGLNFPTALTMGDDGNLYVSVWGFGGNPGDGQIVKVTLKK